MSKEKQDDIYIYIHTLKTNMEKENDETKNDQKDNDLTSEKHKTVYMTLNYLVHFVVFVSVVSGCVAISVFASLVLLL